MECSSLYAPAVGHYSRSFHPTENPRQASPSHFGPVFDCVFRKRHAGLIGRGHPRARIPIAPFCPCEFRLDFEKPSREIFFTPGDSQFLLLYKKEIATQQAFLPETVGDVLPAALGREKSTSSAALYMKCLRGTYSFECSFFRSDSPDGSCRRWARHLRRGRHRTPFPINRCQQGINGKFPEDR